MQHHEGGPTPAPDATAGDAAERRFGGFFVESLLGSGGMGSVYLARRAADGLLVALKILNPVAGANADLVRRFLREAHYMLELDHINIVKAFELGSVNGQHFISMEYVKGENLASRIRREGRVEPAAALDIVRQVASGLDYGWRRGVVHRDLKPANILVGTEGVCKLADMGLAVLAKREDLRLTVPGTIMGTPEYMSPEQARAERDVDTRSDIYSLGCSIYEAVCGQPPFEGANPIAILQKHVTEKPVPPRKLAPALSPGTERILLKCMETERGDRFQTCAGLVEAIDRELASSAGAPEPGAAPGARRNTSRVHAFEDDASSPSDAVTGPTVHARTSAPAGPGGAAARPPAAPNAPARKGPEGPPARRGPPRSVPTARRRAPADTRATVCTPGRSAAYLPFVALALAGAAVLLAVLVTILLLFAAGTG